MNTAMASTRQRSGRTCLAMLMCLGLIAAAQEAHSVTTFQKSAYTAVDRKACKMLRSLPNGDAYLCHGLDGFSVYLAEVNGRTFVAGGTDPEKSQAARQSLAALNTPFAHPSDRATVEWRFVIRDKRKVPFAMIVRYFTQLEKRRGEVLVVTRIAGTEACHVAYIDALANENAIVMARKIADDRARKADCKGAATIEGERGQSPM